MHWSIQSSPLNFYALLIFLSVVHHQEARVVSIFYSDHLTTVSIVLWYFICRFLWFLLASFLLYGRCFCLDDWDFLLKCCVWYLRGKLDCRFCFLVFYMRAELFSILSISSCLILVFSWNRIYWEIRWF